jgi:hypothetical protein
MASSDLDSMRLLVWKGWVLLAVAESVLPKQNRSKRKRPTPQQSQGAMEWITAIKSPTHSTYARTQSRQLGSFSSLSPSPPACRPSPLSRCVRQVYIHGLGRLPKLSPFAVDPTRRRRLPPTVVVSGARRRRKMNFLGRASRLRLITLVSDFFTWSLLCCRSSSSSRICLLPLGQFNRCLVIPIPNIGVPRFPSIWWFRSAGTRGHSGPRRALQRGTRYVRALPVHCLSCYMRIMHGASNNALVD